MRRFLPRLNPRFLQPFLDMGQELLNVLFVAFMGATFLINDSLFLSLYTTVRNALAPDKESGALLDDVHFVGINDEAMEVARAYGHHTYRVLADALSLISGYAVENHDTLVVAGVDFLLDDGSYLAPGQSSAAIGLNELANVLNGMPINMHVIIGASLEAANGGYRLSSINGAYSYVRYQLDDAAARRFNVGHVNYLTASRHSGIETLDIARTALGYIPVVMEDEMYCSLPALMYAAGERMLDVQADVEQDFGMGSIRMINASSTWSAFTDKLSNRLFLYNNFINKDIRDGKNNLILSDYSGAFSYSGLYNGYLFNEKVRQGRENSLKVIQGAHPIAPETAPTDYFIVYRMPPPDYYNAEADLIFPVNATRDSFTGEYIPVPGTTAHAIALVDRKSVV